MDVFDLRERLVNDYASYTRSFIKIADPVSASATSRHAGGSFNSIS